MGNGSPEELGEPRRSEKAGGKPTIEELRKRFFYRPPRDENARLAHERVSQLTFELAVALTQLCYPGRQLSLALTDLESVRMRANASIACDDPRD